VVDTFWKLNRATVELRLTRFELVIPGENRVEVGTGAIRQTDSQLQTDNRHFHQLLIGDTAQKGQFLLSVAQCGSRLVSC
jgi:aspartyl-tRNA synthetase